MYKYCTTLNSYTGDSRAAFNILSLHQNRYLIYCCRQLQVFSSRILLVLVIFLQNRGDVYIYSTVVATLQFWLKVTEMNLNHFKFYDELNHNAIQMNYSILVFIFYSLMYYFQYYRITGIFKDYFVLSSFLVALGQSRILCP